MNCETCGDELVVGSWPFCHGTGSHTPGNSNVITDDIPGGLAISHGLCWPDGTPRKFYSKSEIAREAKAKGLRNHVEHVTPPGTDKSPHTVRWV